ncbi:hypothetical protein ATO10_11857 [Actibacterium atlanticum]|uniref:Uncharacterized protein n=1 Tax=Actibacterium atlanticum TaxID=1461693 RepID=A0A058ZLD5_9RHOB|nr:hypothetical protein [Actibacterium atlanticum]KCV81606.1 hypothetical protein ATO10_11857 [Actibacterium atlanticum]
MPLVLIILIVALIVMFYRFKTTSLTRNCRWREDRAEACWRCAFCGARQEGAAVPKRCLQR